MSNYNSQDRDTHTDTQPPTNPFQSGMYSQNPPPQVQPKTIMLECNRDTGFTSSTGLNSQNHRWTTEFPNGIQLKTGDVISVNSAFLSSTGVGDLIAWDTDDNSDTQDNKARWIFSFYVSNDGKNDKREGYNLIEGSGCFPYDTDNQACRLHRNTEKYDFYPTDVKRTNSYADYYALQDPYLPCRFFGATTTIPCPIIDNHIEVYLYTIDVITGLTHHDRKSLLVFKNYNDYESSGGTLNYLNPKTFLSCGQQFRLISQDEPYHTAGSGPTEYNNKHLTLRCNCWDFIELRTWFNDMTIPAGQYGVRIMGLKYLKSTTTPQTYPTGFIDKMTCKVELLQGQLRRENVSLTNFGLDKYDVIGNWWGSENIILADKSYTLLYRDTASVDNNATPTSATKNLDNSPFEIYSSGTKDLDKKIKIIILSLTDTTPAPHTYPVPEWVIEINFAEGSSMTTIDDLYAYNDNSWSFSFELPVILGATKMVEKVFAWGGNSEYNTSSPSNFYSCEYMGTPNHFRFKAVRRNLGYKGTSYSNNFNPPVADIPTIIDATQQAYFFRSDLGNETDWTFYETNRYAISLCKKWFLEAEQTNGVMKNYYLTEGQGADLKETYNQDIFQEPNAFSDDGCNLTYGYGTASEEWLGKRGILCGIPTDLHSTIPVIHYEYHDFSIDEPYSSPSDIATALTKQTHETKMARDIYGNDVSNSDKGGLIQNKFLVPVWTNDIPEKNTPPYQYTLDGELSHGTYFLKCYMYKNIENRITAGQFLPAGEYNIYFRTKNTSINKPTYYSATSVYLEDFNQRLDPQYAKSYGKTAGDVKGFPMRYIEGKECWVSQFVGSDNVTFSYDATQSRFTIGYLHQPHISTFDASTGTGGKVSATIYTPSPDAQGYNYKRPMTRCGGINIENWYSKTFTRYDDTMADIRTRFGLDADVDLSSNWFIKWRNNDLSSPDFNKVTDTINKDPVGLRFWTKLGFTENQLDTTFQGNTMDTIDYVNQYIPTGTTDGNIDVADAIVLAVEPAENTPYYYTQEKFGASTTDVEAKYEFSSFGGLQLNNHSRGYGLPNTSGMPLQFKPNVAVPTAPNPFSEFNSSYNPDRQISQGYTIETQSTFLVADNLPVKTKDAYYFIISDLVDSDFFISVNGGCEANIVGIISKLNNEGDYYYQYQAPQSFYCKKDRLITSVTTEIRTPNLTIPVAISPYSSVIYQVMRYTPEPVKSTAPLWYKQQQYFSWIDNYMKRYIELVNKENTPQAVRVDNIMSQLANVVLTNNPQQADLLTSIERNYEALGLHQKLTPNERQKILLDNADTPQAKQLVTSVKELSRYKEATLLKPLQQTEQGYLGGATQIRDLPQATRQTIDPSLEDLLDEVFTFRGANTRIVRNNPIQTAPSVQDIYDSFITTYEKELRLNEPIGQSQLHNLDELEGYSGLTEDQRILLRDLIDVRLAPKTETEIEYYDEPIPPPLLEEWSGEMPFMRTRTGADKKRKRERQRKRRAEPVYPTPPASIPAIVEEWSGDVMGARQEQRYFPISLGKKNPQDLRKNPQELRKYPIPRQSIPAIYSAKAGYFQEYDESDCPLENVGACPD